MEILPVAILLSVQFIGSVIAFRFFLGQISRKIDQISSTKQVDISSYPVNTYQPPSPVVMQKADRPAKNDVMDEQNEIDFDESMQIVPKHIKLEVEGGDSFAPPGYSVK